MHKSADIGIGSLLMSSIILLNLDMTSVTYEAVQKLESCSE